MNKLLLLLSLIAVDCGWREPVRGNGGRRRERKVSTRHVFRVTNLRKSVV
jgi:hypothetical protein